MTAGKYQKLMSFVFYILTVLNQPVFFQNIDDAHQATSDHSVTTNSCFSMYKKEKRTSLIVIHLAQVICLI